MPASERTPKELRLFLLRTLLITAIILVQLAELRSYVHEPAPNGIFRWLFIQLDFPAGLLATAILVLGLAPAVQTRAVAVVEWIGSHPGTTAVLSLVVMAAAAVLVYHNHPVSMDEYTALFQSRAFAAGRLAGQFPPELLDWLVPDGFRGVFFAVSTGTGRVASWYWPGWALLLTPFTWLGVPWLCNPVLGAATVILVHRAALALGHDRWMAGLAVLLTIASPAVTVNAISYYSMPAHLVANLAFLLLLLHPAPARLLLAGLVGSVALALNNPVPHLVFALPWILYLAIRKDRLRTLPWLAAGYLPLALMLDLGWPVYLGSLLWAGQTGGGPDSGETVVGLLRLWRSQIPPTFGLPGADLLYGRLIGLEKVWLWAVPGLPVLALMGVWRGRSARPNLLLAGSALALTVVYLLVLWDEGHGWGSRYLYPAWMALPLLAVAALGPESRDGGRGLARFVAGIAVLSLGLGTGLRLTQVHRFISAHLAQRPQAVVGTPEIVLVNRDHGLYSIDLVQNDPFLRNRPLIMLGLGDRDSTLLRRMDPSIRLLGQDARGLVWGRR